MKKTIFIFLLLITFLFLAPVKVQAQASTTCDESNGGTNGLVPCGNKTKYIYQCKSYNRIWTCVYVHASYSSTIYPTTITFRGVGYTNVQAREFCTNEMINNPPSSVDVASSAIVSLVYRDADLQNDIYENTIATSVADAEATARISCNMLIGAKDFAELRYSGRDLICRCELPHIFILLFNVYRFVIFTIAVPLAGLLILIGGGLLIVGGGYPKLHDTGKRILWGAVWSILLIFSSWLIINVVLLAIGYNAKWYEFIF